LKWVEGIGRTKPMLLAREVTVKINVLEPNDIVAFA
jgi:hypothetical protein